MVGGSLEGDLTANEHRVAIVASHVYVEGSVFVQREATGPLAVWDVFNSVEKAPKKNRNIRKIIIIYASLNANTYDKI